MTEDRKPETPGMADISAKFEQEAEAAARNVQDAIKAGLDKIPPRGDDETQIAHTYRKLLMMRAGQPRGLSEDDLAACARIGDLV